MPEKIGKDIIRKIMRKTIERANSIQIQIKALVTMVFQGCYYKSICKTSNYITHLSQSLLLWRCVTA